MQPIHVAKTQHEFCLGKVYGSMADFDYAAVGLMWKNYWSIENWLRRFCCQHASLCSVQKGFSLP